MIVKTGMQCLIWNIGTAMDDRTENYIDIKKCINTAKKKIQCLVVGSEMKLLNFNINISLDTFPRDR